MPEFRYPDGSWPRPIKEVAASICCIDGTTSANQAEHLHHASGHYYGGLRENVNHRFRCKLVPCSWLAATVEELANHVRGHEEFNLLNGDASFDRLFELLRAAQPAPRPPPSFRMDEKMGPSPRPRPSPQPRPSPRPGPPPRPGPSPRYGQPLRPQTPSGSPSSSQLRKINLRRSSPRLGLRMGLRVRPRLGSWVGSLFSSRQRRKAAQLAVRPSAQGLPPALTTPRPTPPPTLPSPLLPQPLVTLPPSGQTAPPQIPPPLTIHPSTSPSQSLPTPIPPAQSVTPQRVILGTSKRSPERQLRNSGSPSTISPSLLKRRSPGSISPGTRSPSSPKKRLPGSASPGSKSTSFPVPASQTPNSWPQGLPHPGYSPLKKFGMSNPGPSRATSPEIPSPIPFSLLTATKELRNTVTKPSPLHKMTRDTFKTILPFKKRILTVAPVSAPVVTRVHAACTETSSSMKFNWWEKVISAKSLEESAQIKTPPQESGRHSADSDSSTKTNGIGGFGKRKQQRYPESASQ